MIEFLEHEISLKGDEELERKSLVQVGLSTVSGHVNPILIYRVPLTLPESGMALVGINQCLFYAEYYRNHGVEIFVSFAVSC